MRHLIPVDSSLGGDVRARIDHAKLMWGEAKCPNCSKKINVYEPKGYMHEHGIMDECGRGWNVVYPCDCGWTTGILSLEHAMKNRRYGADPSDISAIISCLRSDARMTLREMSCKTGMSTSVVKRILCKVLEGWKFSIEPRFDDETK